MADNAPRATLSNAPPLGGLSRMLHTNALLYRQGEELFGGNGERVLNRFLYDNKALSQPKSMFLEPSYDSR